MEKYKGDDLLVMYNDNGTWKVVAYATTCELDINATTIPTANPKAGKWPKQKLKSISWKVTSAHLLSDHEGNKDMMQLLATGREVELKFSTVKPHTSPQDPADYVADDKFSVGGKALVTRYTVTANHRDFVKASVAFIGSGENDYINELYGKN